MSEKKTIAVVGATGTQGGGLARAILEDDGSQFAVRALTRKPDSDAARALADRGAEVVQADLDEPGTVRRAFDGAYGAFCVTNYWEYLSPEREKAQVETMARAAKETGLRHVVWSTLEDTREYIPLDDDRMPTLKERYTVPHFDAKAEADEFFRKNDVPTTFFSASFYWDNLIHFGMEPQRGEDGVLRFVLPMDDARMPGIAAEDIGRCAYGVFRAGEEKIGERVGVAGEHLSGAEMAEALGDALGEKVEHAAVSPDEYRSFDFPGADDLGNMFQFYRDFEDEFRALRPVEESRRLNPRLESFREWLDENVEKLPVE